MRGKWYSMKQHTVIHYIFCHRINIISIKSSSFFSSPLLPSPPYTIGLRIPAIWLAKKRGFFFYWPTVCAVQDMYAYNSCTRNSHASSKFTVQSSKFSVHSSKFSMHPVKYICLAHAHVTCEFAIAMCPITSYLLPFLRYFHTHCIKHMTHRLILWISGNGCTR